MPRDYKNINKGSKKKNSVAIYSRFLSFSTGLTIGLFIAFLVYLHEHQPNYQFPFKTPFSQIADKQIDIHKQQEDNNSALLEPKFEFFEILPNREVNISEWIAEEQEKAELDPDDSNIYVFQVGSFKEYKAADQTRAKLALIGINAVILNRVKIGKNCIIGANALITENKDIPDNSFVLGSPAKIIKEVTPEQVQGLQASAATYVERAKMYLS